MQDWAHLLLPHVLLNLCQFNATALLLYMATNTLHPGQQDPSLSRITGRRLLCGHPLVVFNDRLLLHQLITLCSDPLQGLLIGNPHMGRPHTRTNLPGLSPNSIIRHHSTFRLLAHTPILVLLTSLTKVVHSLALKLP